MGRIFFFFQLPFGYVDSPRLFCAVMEAMADKLRRKAAALGGGMHFFVFVDDWLCVGDTDALTRQACELLEQELRDRGIAWAPHKHRGPAVAFGADAGEPGWGPGGAWNHGTFRNHKERLYTVYRCPRRRLVPLYPFPLVYEKCGS